MDNICIAITRKGLCCTRSKVNENYCKIHTTNEVCSICNSTQISSTESIFKSSGISWCKDCRKIKSDETIARANECLIQQRIKHKAQRIANEKMLREMLLHNKDILEQANQYHIFENMVNQMCYEYED